jgi:hypothetical protein
LRTIIAGSRGITDYNILKKVMNKTDIKVSVILSGGAKGVDELGARFARENNIPLEVYKADWNKFGKRAGIIRNNEMAKNAGALIAVWDGTSQGTHNMISVARNKQLKVELYDKCSKRL